MFTTCIEFRATAGQASAQTTRAELSAAVTLQLLADKGELRFTFEMANLTLSQLHLRRA